MGGQSGRGCPQSDDVSRVKRRWHAGRWRLQELNHICRSQIQGYIGQGDHIPRGAFGAQLADAGRKCCEILIGPCWNVYQGIDFKLLVGAILADLCDLHPFFDGALHGGSRE